MEPRCSLCNKTIKQLAEEELNQSFFDRKSLNIRLDSELAYPYLLCGDCEDFLRAVIPKVLEAEGIIQFDEKKEKYTLTKE